MSNLFIQDDFISRYDELRRYADDADFTDYTNPVDGVRYPLICEHVPAQIRQEIVAQLSKFAGRMIRINALFMRLSPANAKAPHIAHTDLVMGKFSCMLYLNDSPGAGTALLRHKPSGATYHPADERYLAATYADTNRLEAWDVLEIAEMKQNRAAIFDAGHFHCAMPVGGFGQSSNDARCVLTVFFS